MPKKVHPWGPFTDFRQAEQHILSRAVIYQPPDEHKRIVSIGQIIQPTPECKVAQLRFGNPGGFNMPQEKYAIDDPGFNSFRFDPLGWINHDMGTILAELLPIRQTRRGYGRENVDMWWFGKGSSLGNPGEAVSLNDLLLSEGFNEMLRDEYPTLNEALPAVFGNEGMNIAVSRKLAIQVDDDGYTWLWRLSERIAMFSDRETCNLGKRYEYLREELLESLLFNEGVWLK